MNTSNRKTRAFAMIELLLMLFVALILLMIVVAGLSKGRGRSARIQCVSNLKDLGLAARIFAIGNLNLYPGDFLTNAKGTSFSLTAVELFRTFQKEITTPRILVCPADKGASPAGAMNVVGPQSISYFANVNATETNPSGLLFGDSNLQLGTNPIASRVLVISSNTPLAWTRERHWNNGNAALADGSVQQFSSARLQAHLLSSGIVSNTLVFPR